MCTYVVSVEPSTGLESKPETRFERGAAEKERERVRDSGGYGGAGELS